MTRTVDAAIQETKIALGKKGQETKSGGGMPRRHAIDDERTHQPLAKDGPEDQKKYGLKSSALQSVFL